MIGALTGGLVWLYDYDFLLNPGGPNTHISDAILKQVEAIIGINMWSLGSSSAVVFTPLGLLVVTGALLGVAFHFVLKGSKDRTNHC